MKVEQKGHTTTIKDTKGNTELFLKKFIQEYNSFKDKNLILDISHDIALTIETIKQFSDVMKMHKKNKKSMVLVTDKTDFNKVPASITLVPTLLEAHDIIEMEEIERDLGF